jgi:hypothetical protein
MNPSASAQAALLDTLQQLQDRAQVEACLHDMLTDVELSVQLQKQLQTRHEIQSLRRLMEQQQLIIAECTVLRRETTKEQKYLADALLQDLVRLSKELGELKQVKSMYEELLVQYDEVVAKLLQNEEDSLERQQESADQTNKEKEEAVKSSENMKVVDDGKPEASSLMEDEPESEAIENLDIKLPALKSAHEDKAASNIVEKPVIDASPVVEHADATAAGASASNVQVASMSEKQHEEQVEDAVQDASLDDGVVLLDDEDDDDPTPTLDSLETETLMKIFAFLDALDILNTAQINISMYSRVDSLFGFGGGGGGDTPGIGDTSTIATDETAPAASHTTATAATTASSKDTAVSSITQPTVAQIPPKKQTPPKQQTQMPAPRTPAASSSTTKHSYSNSGDSLGSGRGGIFAGLLQPRRQQQSPQSPKASATQYQRSASAPDNVDSTPLPMNAAMANSMAAKLSDAELNAIILMTERLKHKEMLAAKLQKENDDLIGKLDGTEAVKQFLVAKVRDMEAAISSTVENEVKVAQQISSDQEVIAFLDGRVQELEREARILREEKQSAAEDLERIKKQSEQKATVMGDMLQFEREKVKDGEREFKATKKLLVKEVKNCRAQIMALQAERDGYREQNLSLRKAVFNSPNGHSRKSSFT